MAITTEQRDLLQALASGTRVVYDFPDYFYRYDKRARCRVAGRKLVAAGLIALPVVGRGRDCTITATGRAQLKA